MDADDITALQVTIALQALQIDALRSKLGWQVAADVELQLVERLSQAEMPPAVDEAATAWAVGVLRERGRA